MTSSSRRSAFLGNTDVVIALRRKADRLANFPFPILITGDTGTGKYELALFMHERSKRAKDPVVDVHCANLTQTLFESELFGHERGAFTDAREQRKGRIETAGTGTLVFDEIDCLDMQQQARMLRFIDRRTYERVGGRVTLHSSAALIFTTNQNLQDMVETGTFRRDLLARVCWSVLDIPPLRERADDISFLAGMFLEEARLEFGIASLQWETAALQRLQQHDWPGNVRELKSVAYLAAYLHDGDTIRARAIDEIIRSRQKSSADPGSGPVLSLVHARNDFEREIIADALRQTDGNRVRAARLLRIARRTLHEKISKYGL